MINRKLITEQFNNYVSDYDATNPKVALKIAHTYRVADISEKIVTDLGLSDNDRDIAWVIGMLHDIGRFEQIKRFNTFNDMQSVDHAKFGVRLLFDEGLIERFELDESIYSLVRTAIWNHNLYRIEEGLDERTLEFCKIIRDADKVDIFRANYETPMEDIYNTTREVLINEGISDAVYQAFFEGVAIRHSIKETHIDRLVGHLSLVLELEYPISRSILRDSGYLVKLLEFQSKNPLTMKRLADIREYMDKIGMI